MNKAKWEIIDRYLEPISKYLEMDGVTEIMGNRYDTIFIERYGDYIKVEERFSDEQAVCTLIKQISNALNQDFHEDYQPLLNARLPDGSRISATFSSVTAEGASFSIRVKSKESITVDMLLKQGAIRPEMAEYLCHAMDTGKNGIISGGTGSGKTTLMNILIGFIPKSERIVTIEDTRELVVDSPNKVCMEAPIRKKQVGGQDRESVDMAVLTKHVLRYNPDRIIVGEMREAKASEAFLEAMNTGHRGVCATIHANNTADVIDRLSYLSMSSSPNTTYQQAESRVISNVEFLCHMEKIRGRGRIITQISEIYKGKIVDLFAYDKKHHKHVALAASEVMDRKELCLV